MRPNFYEVPVHRLMCKDVRMHQILTEPRPLHYKEMRLFLNLLAEVVDRWYEAVAPIHDDISMNHDIHQELVREVKDSYCFTNSVRCSSHLPVCSPLLLNSSRSTVIYFADSN